MRLEKQLEEARARLAAAEKNLAQKEKELEPVLAPLRQQHEDANAKRDRAHSDALRVEREVRVQMGVDTKEWREVVARWAGFASLAEAEEHAVERGTAMLPAATTSLANHFVGKHTRVRAARLDDSKACTAASTAYNKIYLAEAPLRAATRAVTDAKYAVQEIENKLRSKAAAGPKVKSPREEQISPQDRERFVAARQKLRAAMTQDHTDLINHLNAKCKGATS